jgi:hypothetical protein
MTEVHGFKREFDDGMVWLLVVVCGFPVFVVFCVFAVLVFVVVVAAPACPLKVMTIAMAILVYLVRTLTAP